MKKLLTLFLSICLVFGASSLKAVETKAEMEQFSLPPSEFVQKIGAGWNLGNTFENYLAGSPTVEEQEYGWYQPITQKGMIQKVYRTGFNAVRIPVSWGPQTTYSNGKYNVKLAFLQRIEEVVKWCYEYDMYVIINMHHDDNIRELKNSGAWLNLGADDAQWEVIKDKYQQIWEQVAEYFSDYDEHLILEGANEMLAPTAFDGCGSSTTSGCWWGHNSEVFLRQYELYEIFVNTVRESGGNNDKRYLMLPTYGAQWYENQVQNLGIPNADDHIIVDIHWYKTSDQINEKTRQSYANMWQRYAKQRGFGVVIGECGFNESTADSYKQNWANTFVKDLRQNYKIPVFLWDDGGNMKILDRSSAPYMWTANSQLYVKKVVEVSKPYILKEPEALLGDVNSDKEFGMVDLLLFRKYLYKAEGYIKEMPKEADVNSDGVYDVKDLLKMARVQANKDHF